MWSIYTTILIFGLSSRAYTENSCPDEEDIFPCHCDVLCVGKIYDCVNQLTVTCKFYKETGDFETLRKGISSLSGKKDVHLTLRGYNISMPSKLFSGIDIKQLIFINCHMYSLTNDDQPWFLGLENKLQDLIILNSLTAQEKFNIGQLHKLNSLTLRRNQIPELEDLRLSNLEILYIYQNNIKKIGSKVFSQLNYLKELVSDGNRFGPIKRSMFPTTAEKLKYVSLDNNSFTDLSEDIFTGMPSIDSLSLMDNEIKTLDERTWSPIWQQLRSLGLYGNKIICDDRLNWILKSKKWPAYVNGRCSGPKEWKDKFLRVFFESLSQ